MIELEDDSLERLVADNDAVIVQYGAAWCGNCRIIKPKFRRLSSENKDVMFVYIDAEKLPNSKKLADVTNLPTFAGFRKGKFVSQSQGNKVELITDILNEITDN